MAKENGQIPELREMSGWNRFELRLYRRLGVLPFRKLLFRVERLRHCKDGGRNKNYHMGRLSVYEAGRFEGYLLYNTFLHTLGLVLMVLFFVLKHLCYPVWHWAEWLLLLPFLLNLWCIFLQRYNLLRIRQLRIHRRDVLKERVRREADRLYGKAAERCSAEQLRTDLELAERMLTVLRTGGAAVLEHEDAAGLERMGSLFAGSKKQGSGAEDPAVSLEAKSAPYTRVERRVSGLQRLFAPGSDILSPCSIVTADAETEAAFDRLFPRKTADSMEETICVLKDVMEYALSEKNEVGRGDHGA